MRRRSRAAAAGDGSDWRAPGAWAATTAGSTGDERGRGPRGVLRAVLRGSGRGACRPGRGCRLCRSSDQSFLHYPVSDLRGSGNSRMRTPTSAVSLGRSPRITPFRGVDHLDSDTLGLRKVVLDGAMILALALVPGSTRGRGVRPSRPQRGTAQSPVHTGRPASSAGGGHRLGRKTGVSAFCIPWRATANPPG